MLLLAPGRFGVFRPDKIASCVAWWDAQFPTSIVTSGPEVQTWEDRIAGLTLAKETAGPTENTVAGMNMLTFAGTSSQRLKVTSAVPDIGTGDKSYLIVFRAGSKAADMSLMGKTDGVSPNDLYGFRLNENAAGSVYFEARDGAALGNVEDTSKEWTDNQIRYLLVTIDQSAGDVLFYADDFGTGNEVDSDLAFVFTDISPAAAFYVGTIDGTTEFFTGQIGEIAIFDEVLSEDDRLNLEEYVKDRWGLNPYVSAPGLPASVDDPTGWYSSYSASDYTLDTGVVTQLNDKSGNGNHLTEGAGVGPTLVGVNGFNWLDFENTTPTVLTGSNTDINPGAGDFTVVCVFKTTDTTRRGLFAKDQDGNEYFGVYTAFSNSRSLRYAMRDITFANTLALDHNDAAYNYVDGNPKIMVFTYDDSEADALLFDRNTSAAKLSNLTYASGDIIPAATFRLGAWLSGGENFTGEIAEILFYDRPLTASERDDLIVYLMRKWDLFN